MTSVFGDLNGLFERSEHNLITEYWYHGTALVCLKEGIKSRAYILCLYIQMMRRENANTKPGRRTETTNTEERKKQNRAKILPHKIHDPGSSVPT